MAPSSITVAIVEDNADICESIEEILRGAPGFECVCACRNVRTALRKIPLANPDVVIMDIGLPDGSGIECTAELKRLVPAVQVLMYTIHEDSEQIFKALEAGASGYLLKRSSTTQMLDALRDMTHGGVPMTGAIARKVIASFQKPPGVRRDLLSSLTPREMAVMDELVEGLSAKEIAAALAISTDTVNAHLKHIYQKLHARSRVDAVVTYLKNK